MSKRERWYRISLTEQDGSTSVVHAKLNPDFADADRMNKAMKKLDDATDFKSSTIWDSCEQVTRDAACTLNMLAKDEKMQADLLDGVASLMLKGHYNTRSRNEFVKMLKFVPDRLMQPSFKEVQQLPNRKSNTIMTRYVAERIDMVLAICAVIHNHIEPIGKILKKESAGGAV